MKQSHVKYRIIPAEGGMLHSSFSAELYIFSLIREGNCSLIQDAVEEYFSQEMTMGRMSGNNLRQVQYWAVATISVAVHYAILGGLEENAAFDKSDEAIMKVDSCYESEEIFSVLKNKAIELTRMVSDSKASAGNTAHAAVRKAVSYVSRNLTRRITVAQVAEHSSVSQNYISRLFKKELGISLPQYIYQKKVQAAKAMLLKGESNFEVSYSLGFCSESHFIQCFKKYEGVSPRKWLENSLKGE